MTPENVENVRVTNTGYAFYLSIFDNSSFLFILFSAPQPASQPATAIKVTAQKRSESSQEHTAQYTDQNPPFIICVNYK